MADANDHSIATVSRLSRDWKAPFLTALRNTGNVRAALLQTGINRKTYEKSMQRSAEFRRQITEALDEANEVVEFVVRGQAIAGNIRAAEFWLRHNMPEKYGDKAKDSPLNVLVMVLTRAAERNGIPADDPRVRLAIEEAERMMRE